MKNSPEKNKKYPQIIFLYGPAGCGKGTQAMLLESLLPNYVHIEFGSLLRSFVDKNKDSNDIQKKEVAERIKNKINDGLVTSFEDLKFVTEGEIRKVLDSGKGVILDGAGRSLIEADCQSKFMSENNVSSIIFQLHIPLETTVQRTANRWYVKDSKKIFTSYSEAKLNCLKNEEPFQREDDLEIDKIRNRYFTQYSDLVAKVLRTYQLVGGSRVYFVDARKSISSVNRFIMDILNYEPDKK